MFLGLLHPTRRAQSNLGLLCFRRNCLRYAMRRSCCAVEGWSPIPTAVLRMDAGTPRPRRGRRSPKFSMCTRPFVSVHCLGKKRCGAVPTPVFLLKTRKINVLSAAGGNGSVANVVDLPNDSDGDVADPPKDSWIARVGQSRERTANVADLPNNPRGSAPPSPTGPGNRRRIGAGVGGRGRRANVAVLPVKPPSAVNRPRNGWGACPIICCLSMD